MASQKRKTTEVGLGAVREVRGSEAPPEPRTTIKLPKADRAARTTLPIPGTVAPLVEAREERAREEKGGEEKVEKGPSSVPTSTRRSKTPRTALAVDDVGDAAMRIGSAPPKVARPKVAKTRRELADAPIDHREAFLLSLIDGKMNVSSLIDVSGIPEVEVLGMLSRLRRLGIIVYG